MSIQAPVRVWGLTCPGSPEEVGRARRWTRDILRGCPRADDVALIASELVTNAITHTASGSHAGTFHIALARSEHTVAITVIDTGGTRNEPRISQAGQDATHGRGLGMVATLATTLQVHGDHHGRTITAELTMPPTDEAPNDRPRRVMPDHHEHAL